MIIREQQLSQMKDSAVIDFENRMIQHLQILFPRHHAALGESRLREITRSGIARAGFYRIDAERPVCLFIDLMFLLGSDFDRDPQLPWTAEILADPDLTNQFERMNKLYNTALQYLDEVAGPENQHIKSALLRLRPDQKLVPPEVSPAELKPYLAGRFREAFPQKCNRIGGQRLNAMIQSGVKEARARGIAGPQGTALYVSLMFALGSGFASDPVFPWAQEALKEPGLGETERVSRLLQGARGFMQLWLS